MEMKELQRHKEELQQKLSDPEIFSNSKKVKDLSVELSKVEKELENQQQMEEIDKRTKELEEIVKEEDKELKLLAEEELKTLREKKEKLTQKIKKAKENLPDNLIMEIRAGAGGDEASLFAKNLFDMYSRFAEKRGWKTTLLHESKSDLKGYKEVVFEIAGEGAYSSLRFESGVHRVQRIPETEKSGRVHTSTASVAVLPKAREIDIEIKPQDIKMEFFRSSGPGGQNVNKVETAVRVIHIPTGLVITSQESRSQQKNRERAMEILRAKLFDEHLRKETEKAADTRKKQIGTGDRSEKIRTYNYPQDRITDHRIKESWHNIEKIINGELEPIINAIKERSN